MTLPSMLLGVVISSLYGATFHLLRGGNLGRLILYIILAWVGFWIGHFAAGVLDWPFWSIGELHVGLGTVVSVLFLVGGYWLSLIQVEGKQK
jgi:hypothetical protein